MYRLNVVDSTVADVECTTSAISIVIKCCYQDLSSHFLHCIYSQTSKMETKNPFHFTEEEKEMMKDDWKKKKKSKLAKASRKSVDVSQIHQKHTISSKRKIKMSDDLFNFL